LLKNGIFIEPELREKFTKVDELAWAALTEHQTNKQHDITPNERSAMEKFVKEGEPLGSGAKTSLADAAVYTGRNKKVDDICAGSVGSSRQPRMKIRKDGCPPVRPHAWRSPTLSHLSVRHA
jgi:hypothetical protein